MSKSIRLRHRKSRSCLRNKAIERRIRERTYGGYFSATSNWLRIDTTSTAATATSTTFTVMNPSYGLSIDELIDGSLSYSYLA